MNLLQKIRLITRKAAKVERQEDGFTHIEDVLDVISGLLHSYGLLFIGELSDSAAHSLPKGCVHVVTMLWTLADVQSKETHAWRIPGSGYDTDYDGTGIAKAITASRKAALILIFNLRIVEKAIETDREKAQAKADAIAQEKIAAANAKRKETNAAKEYVKVVWPEAHNGHQALFRGKLCIMEHKAFKVMEEAGKFVDREDGWLVPEAKVNGVIGMLKELGCSVFVEE